MTTPENADLSDDEAEANMPCTGCDCCSHTDCEQRFCMDCPCTTTRQSAEDQP